MGVLLASGEVQGRMDLQEGEENRCKEDKTAQVIREKYKRFMVRKRWQRNETKKTMW